MMSYQVLARKYRPATFQELEGQEHVLQALINALNNNRLHHAYLFTGTRGVGKTSIARILAKCFNCEQGVTATPCGECGSCVEIASGRNVDLLEIDAASRTGVDDMRDLLDNVQYMPTVSRFKIYLIDEVHMLSRSSFNAMLKTLEEPPEHIKFLFATTDPKKLPVTVLSRCLQFNLKNLSPEQIVHYLGQVLEVESIPFDESALWQLGHAADGSMRDALSLTDQAISFGSNQVREKEVRLMLGTIGHHEVYEIIDTIAVEDGARLLQKIAHLAEFSPDYAALLNDILAVLHRIAIVHAVPDAIDNSQGDQELILAASNLLSAEQVQLLYQIGLIGQRDLPLAPTQRVGLEMILLRMMSFILTEPGQANSVQVPDANAPTTSPTASPTKPPPTDSTQDKIAPSNKEKPPTLNPDSWSDVLELLNLTGVTHTLAANSSLRPAQPRQQNAQYILAMNEDHARLWNASHEQRIATRLSDLYGREVSLSVEVGKSEAKTPAQQQKRIHEKNLAQAIADIGNDRKVQALIKKFNGKLDPDSVVPLHQEAVAREPEQGIASNAGKG